MAHKIDSICRHSELPQSLLLWRSLELHSQPVHFSHPQNISEKSFIEL